MMFSYNKILQWIASFEKYGLQVLMCYLFWHMILSQENLKVEGKGQHTSQTLYVSCYEAIISVEKRQTTLKA